MSVLVKRERLVEVVGTEGSAGLDALVVEGEALDQQLGKARGGPLAEGGPARGADAVADGEDGVERVVLDLTGHVAGTLALNYPETPDSCFASEFALVVNVDEVFVCGLH